MTGFGRADEIIDGMSITVEIKSVNHKYFEFYAKVPRMYGFLEEKLKSYCNSVISRGKVECFVSIDLLEDSDAQIIVNHALAEGYLKAIREISERFSLDGDINAASISRYPDVITLHKEPEDEDKIWAAVKTVAEKAVEKFVAMRQAEGEKLKSDVLSRADLILGNVSFIEERSPQTVKEYNDKLILRMKELLGDASVDETRLLNEAAIFADKIAVAEETVRLRSHIDQLHSFLEADEAIGRKLDFLVQEMNREANTIGSKAQDVEIARHVIAIKAEVEKIREQIQNIE
jgi:uncharacterized protein (TIGR00255 family)